MTSAPHRRASEVSERSARVRRWAALLGLAAVLLVVTVVVEIGWSGWLVRHPGQAWQWARKHLLASSALAVIVGAVGVWVAWAVPRAQQRRAEAREDAKQAQSLAELREAEARAASERQKIWEKRCRSLLVLWPLPEVEDADPFAIGVFYSRRAEAYRAGEPRPPYVPRAGDAELAELLRSQPLVLIKGQSRAGKSRTAFEVATRELNGWRLLVPKDRAALSVLAELDPLPGQGKGVLVWLDDLDEYLAVEDASGLDAGLLDRWAKSDPPVKVLATIRLEEYGRLAATSGELGRAARELLNRFAPGEITLSVHFDDPAEQAAIAELYPNEEVVGGLAEHLAVVHELVDRFEIGQATVPEGAGLVLAAADCRRARLDRPITKEELTALLPVYLEHLRPQASLEEGDVKQGLAWAREPVGRTAALLVGDPVSGFRVADPIVDHIDREGQHVVPPDAWANLVALASPQEAVTVGFAAYTRRQTSASKAAWAKAANSDHDEAAAAGACNLGVLLAEQGDVAGAQRAYEQAIESSHPAYAPTAAFNLGVLLAEQGDVAGAQAAYEQVIESGNSARGPAARFALGRLLQQHGDVAGAQAAYKQAIHSNDPHYAPAAAFALGTLLMDHGDIDDAEEAYQLAIDSRHPRFARAAAVSLGMRLAHEGDFAGAQRAQEIFLELDQP